MQTTHKSYSLYTVSISQIYLKQEKLGKKVSDNNNEI